MWTHCDSGIQQLNSPCKRCLSAKTTWMSKDFPVWSIESNGCHVRDCKSYNCHSRNRKWLGHRNKLWCQVKMKEKLLQRDSCRPFFCSLAWLRCKPGMSHRASKARCKLWSEKTQFQSHRGQRRMLAWSVMLQLRTEFGLVRQAELCKKVYCEWRRILRKNQCK